MPKISISTVTPCYNAEKYIRQTIESVLAQSRPPQEIIVVDDGSTDRSAEIVASFGPPVRLIRQANQGESVARNVGIRAAQGDYVAFLDADDLLESKAYEHLLAAAEAHPGAVIHMGCAWFRDDPTQPYRIHRPTSDAFFPEIIRSNFGPPHCWFTPRVVLLQAGGFAEEIRYFEDWDLWWRVGLTGAALVPIDFVGALYRHHPQSQLATVSSAARAMGHVVVMQRMACELLKDRQHLAVHGEPMFWSAWTALMRARQAGVSWNELRPLSQVLLVLAKQGPAAVRTTKFARLMRLVGVRWAETLRHTLQGEPAARETPAPAVGKASV